MWQLMWQSVWVVRSAPYQMASERKSKMAEPSSSPPNADDAPPYPTVSAGSSPGGVPRPPITGVPNPQPTTPEISTPPPPPAVLPTLEPTTGSAATAPKATTAHSISLEIQEIPDRSLHPQGYETKVPPPKKLFGESASFPPYSTKRNTSTFTDLGKYHGFIPLGDESNSFCLEKGADQAPSPPSTITARARVMSLLVNLCETNFRSGTVWASALVARVWLISAWVWFIAQDWVPEMRQDDVGLWLYPLIRSAWDIVRDRYNPKNNVIYRLGIGGYEAAERRPFQRLPQSVVEAGTIVGGLVGVHTIANPHHSITDSKMFGVIEASAVSFVVYSVLLFAPPRGDNLLTLVIGLAKVASAITGIFLMFLVVRTGEL